MYGVETKFRPITLAQRNSMDTSDEKIIELSKTKTFLLTGGAFIFVALGILMIQMDSTTIQSLPRFNSPLLVHGIGVISIAFFGLCGFFWIRKLFDRRPGLVLSADGIFDNSSAISAGLIPWSEVVGFDIFEVQKQKILIVKVSNPGKYIEVGGTLKQALNMANFKMCGSPIAITSNSLKISFDELLSLCNSYHDKYGKSD